jgi:hypothetical protein
MPQPTSLTIWQQYQLGDPEAFSRLYGEYVQVLYAQGLRMTPDAGLVKDCIHDLFVELWRNRRGVPHPDSVSRYLTEALRASLAAKMQSKPGEAPAEEPVSLPHAPLPAERNPTPRRQPAAGWAVPLPVGRPEVMSLPGYGEAAPHGTGPFSFFAKAVKTIQGMISFH